MKKIDVTFKGGDTETYVDSATTKYTLGFRGAFLVIIKDENDYEAYPAERIFAVSVSPIKTDSK